MQCFSQINKLVKTTCDPDLTFGTVSHIHIPDYSCDTLDAISPMGGNPRRLGGKV